MRAYKVARDAITGRFITKHNAHRQPDTTMVEVILYPPLKPKVTGRLKSKRKPVAK